MQSSKELFIKAFMEAEKQKYSAYQTEIDYAFSEQFERKMDKLISKDKRIKLYTRRRISKGLIAAIIAIIIMFTGMMSISATRTPFLEFLESWNIKGGTTDIQLHPEATPPVDTIKTVYMLTSVPDGFELTTYQQNEHSVFAVWQNEKGEEIVFNQFILDSIISVDNEHEYEEFEMNGYKAYLAVYEKGAGLTWTDGYYWFGLGIPYGGKDEILELSKNISEKIE